MAPVSVWDECGSFDCCVVGLGWGRNQLHGGVLGVRAASVLLVEVGCLRLDGGVLVVRAPVVVLREVVPSVTWWSAGCAFNGGYAT